MYRIRKTTRSLQKISKNWAEARVLSCWEEEVKVKARYEGLLPSSDFILSHPLFYIPIPEVFFLLRLEL